MSSFYWNLNLESRYYYRNTLVNFEVSPHMNILQSKYCFPSLLLFSKCTLILPVVYIEMLKSMTIAFNSSVNIISLQDISDLLFVSWCSLTMLCSYPVSESINYGQTYTIKIVLFVVNYALKLYIDLGNMQILVQEFQGGSWNSSFLSNLQLSLLVLLSQGHM